MNKIKRKCIATNQIENIDNMIRVVKLSSGTFEINSKAKGRGAYIKKDFSLFEKVKRQKLLNRTFKIDVPDNVYEELKKEMEE